jgi:hypothetical protein
MRTDSGFEQGDLHVVVVGGGFVALWIFLGTPHAQQGEKRQTTSKK